MAAYGMPDLALDYELSKSRFATWYETMMGNPKDDAEIVVYPDEGHGFTRRKNLTDYYERTTAFFADKLGPAKR